jgi:hypothetical protein
MGAKGKHGHEDAEHGAAGEGARRGPHGHGKHGMHGPMGILLHGIELRDEQREAIGKALEARRPDKATMEEMGKKHEEMRAKMQAALRAFRAEKFDAAAVLPEHAGKPPFDHLVKALGAIVPVLDAAQRDALADKLEKGPEHMHFRGHEKHGEARGAEPR